MSWRQFQFFDSIPIRDPYLGTDEPLYSDPSLTAICATPKYLIISTENSHLKIIDNQLKLIRSFQAYEKGWNVSFIRYVEDSEYFVTIAERQGQPAMLKLWNIEKLLVKELEKVNDASYHTLVHIKNGSNAFPITCFTFSSNFNILGVGFANGIVVVIRGDLLRDRGSSQTVAYKSHEPITGLELVRNNNYDPLLYVTTTSTVLTVPTTSTYHPGNERILDKNKGADLGTTSLDNDTHGDQLLVARDDGIVYYHTNGTSYTLALEMPKKKLLKYGKYLVIITSNTSTSSSLILNGYSEPTKIVIADTYHKLVSFTQTIPSHIHDLIKFDDDICALTTDGILFKIHEKDIEAQLEIVIKRDLYSVAIQIAEDNVDENLLLSIKRKYGDYLYDRNETAEAMTQYIEALPLGKTSEIIKKYKDSKQVGNLAKYLEEMLQQRIATKEHVTLLLCAYCKLKDVNKLDAFIEKYDQETNKLVSIDFDLDVVIELCRETQFLEQASKLAQALGYSSLAVDILLRDIGDSTQALKYIKTLPVHEILRILVEYSRLLLELSPNVTTALLIDVFTGKYSPAVNDDDIDQSKDETPTLIQSYKAFVNYMSSATSNITSTSSTSDEASSLNKSVEEFVPTYQPPKPRIIFPSFVNNPNEFVIFLEACAESYDVFEGNEKDKGDILTTLFELYLTLGNNSKDASVKQSWEKKAIDLAKTDQKSLSLTSILLISHIFDFSEGQILAHDGSGFEIDQLRSYIAIGDIDGVEKTLDIYGAEELDLYPLALSFYTSSDEVFQKVGLDRFKKVLAKIKNERIMTPLEIIQSLSVNNVATLDLIKDFIIEFVENENKEIEINKKLIASYKSEVDKKLEKIHQIEKGPLKLQLNDCDYCNNKLDTESITSFLCGHVYHKSCLADDSSCPKCAPTRETVMNIRERHRVIGEKNELFQAALDESDNKLKAITDFFGKAIMNDVNQQ